MARKKAVKSFGARPPHRCPRPDCLRDGTISARPTTRCAPPAAAAGGSHRPGADRSRAARPGSSRRRCADARSTGAPASEAALGIEPSISTRASLRAMGGKPVRRESWRRDDSVARAPHPKRGAAPKTGPRPPWRGPARQSGRVGGAQRTARPEALAGSVAPPLPMRLRLPLLRTARRSRRRRPNSARRSTPVRPSSPCRWDLRSVSPACGFVSTAGRCSYVEARDDAVPVLDT